MGCTCHVCTIVRELSEKHPGSIVSAKLVDSELVAHVNGREVLRTKVKSQIRPEKVKSDPTFARMTKKKKSEEDPNEGK